MTLVFKTEVLENMGHIDNDEMEVEPEGKAQMRRFKGQ